MKDLAEFYKFNPYPQAILYSDAQYQPLLTSMGYDVLLQVDEDGYEGDSLILFRDGVRFGVLVFGWGSCSACDRLEGCSDRADLEALRDELNNDIRWGTRQKTIDYLQSKDWMLTHVAALATTQNFSERAISILRSTFTYVGVAARP